MPAVSLIYKARVIALVESGMSYGQVAVAMGIPKSTIYSIVQKRRREQTIVRRPGSGERQISSLAQYEPLVSEIKRSPFAIAASAAATTRFPGSTKTARRRIRTAGIRNYVAARKVGLTPRHKELRLGFALEQFVHDNDFWNRIVFSDEKTFQSSPNCRLRVYRPRNTRYEPQYVQEEDRSRRFSVNM
ncbi:hypothetical protein Zmor_001583 [Zophobas morio]|uniref:Transposase Tc1-like domain-containing protein n=1 Tax=Zophobas morio TaxID=2755281 RepID=A0AA38MSH8_9CUCU|nr:hypothetical protein Zmor_001583 [Zophobas morio]